MPKFTQLVVMESGFDSKGTSLQGGSSSSRFAVLFAKALSPRSPSKAKAGLHRLTPETTHPSITCWKPPGMVACISLSSGIAGICPKSHRTTPSPPSSLGTSCSNGISSVPATPCLVSSLLHAYQTPPHPVPPSALGRAAALTHGLIDFYTSQTSPDTLECRP